MAATAASLEFSPARVVYERVNQEKSLRNGLLSLFKMALRPFISLYSGLVNLKITERWLTTSRVLPVVRCSVLSGGGATYDLAKFRGEVQNLGPNTSLTFHLECQKHIRHSTCLIISKNESGGYSAVFFDAQGADPRQARLGQQTYVDGVVKTLATVSEFCEAIVSDLESPPKLLFSGTNIQADWVSCTAYTAVFINKFRQNTLAPEAFMQGVANHNQVTFWEARALVSRLQ